VRWGPRVDCQLWARNEGGAKPCEHSPTVPDLARVQGLLPPVPAEAVWDRIM
jgi:hypothetical protein